MKLIIPQTMLILLCISTATYAQQSDVNKNGQTVESFVEAFNQRDIDTMLGLAAADMQWMSVAGKQIAVETSSLAELRAAMEGYFNSLPSAKSTIRSVNVSGPFVYALEQASWISNEVEKSQCSMAVYEFNQDKIQNVWYFPSHQCD